MKDSSLLQELWVFTKQRWMNPCTTLQTDTSSTAHLTTSKLSRLNLQTCTQTCNQLGRWYTLVQRCLTLESNPIWIVLVCSYRPQEVLLLLLTKLFRFSEVMVTSTNTQLVVCYAMQNYTTSVEAPKKSVSG